MSVTFNKLLFRIAAKLDSAEVNSVPKTFLPVLTRLIFQEIGDALASGEDVFIEGFGRFYPDYRPPRKVRSGITGKEHTTVPKVFIKFNAFDKLNARVQDYLTVLGFNGKEKKG